MAQILIIDDDGLFRSMLSATLVHFGHTVVEAENGAAGLKVFQRAQPDLIITDLVMPEMEGFEVLMNFKKHNPRPKIMVMSGGVGGQTVDFLEIATRLGASGVLAKPFSTDALMKAIDALLPAERTSPGHPVTQAGVAGG
jgi:CheY-like chemotaxis protein